MRHALLVISLCACASPPAYDHAAPTDTSDPSVPRGVTPYAGCVAVHLRDILYEGGFDYRSTFYWNDSGDLVREEKFDVGDSTYTGTRTWEHDEAGHVVRDAFVEADGTLGQLMTYTWIGDLRTVRLVDVTTNGSIDDRTDYAYDADGRLLTEADDHDYDGSVDSLTEHVWGEEAGSWIDAYTFDRMLNGVVDWAGTHTYTDGHLVASTWDDGADGSDEETWAYEWIDGVLVEHEIRNWEDGVLASIDQYSYTYDAWGRPSAMTRGNDFDGDGPGEMTNDALETWVYDCR